MESTRRFSEGHSVYFYLDNDLAINGGKLQFLIRKLEFNIPSIREEERMLSDEAPRIQEKFGKHPENISWWLQNSFFQNFI
jgi:hypothetical protein